MRQNIDPIKLKASAEHLEWVLGQYPNEDEVVALHQALRPLIEAAKAQEILEPVEHIPGSYNFGDGRYIPYKSPDVGGAYAQFSIELEGGLTSKDIDRLARMQKIRNARMQGGD